MAKFTVVKEAPKTLDKGEIVITSPTFLQEIAENVRKAPSRKQTAINHLREVLNSIATKYDQEMNVMKFRLVNYEGIAYQNDSDLNDIILRILTNERPETLEKYLDAQIRARPTNTKLVYYTGSFSSTTPFYKNGLDLLEEKDVKSYVTGEPKKVVGKPAVTKAEAQAKNEQGTDET